MIIRSLKLSGFRIVGKPIDIRFPEEGKIGILGQNESGKTTILQAIEYALYGLRTGPGSEGEKENLITWGRNEAKLEVEFTSGQEAYVIRRVFSAKQGHKARLAPLIAGIQDKSNSITSLTGIKERIEQITGMDRDSFTKLIYMRQKDLDALRQLTLSKREQLINKVMGIEIFDDASVNVKGDFSKLEAEYEKRDSELKSVHNNKEQYEIKLKQKTDLETSIAVLKENLEQRKDKLDKAKTLLAKYEWLYSYRSTIEVISSLNDQLESVENDIKKISTLKKEIGAYQAAITKFKPEVDRLGSLRNSFLDLEKRIRDGRNSARSTEKRRSSMIKEAGLSGKELGALSKDIAKRKHQQLIGFVSSLIGGLGLSVFGLAFLPALCIVGFLLIGVSAYTFYEYLKLDKLFSASAEIAALTSLLEKQKDSVSSLRTEKERIVSKTSFNSHNEIDRRLLDISNSIRKETGEESIAGLEAVQRKADGSLRALTESKPSDRKQSLEEQITEKKNEVKILEKTKPLFARNIQYDKEQHEQAKSNSQEALDKYNELDKDIQKRMGTIGQLADDLRTLQPDYDLYPKLDQEVESCKAELELLRRVSLELSETSKELRAKVIPHARFIINQILPTLTGGRYSDFDISEDLKFKIHSNEAGGYKEREIFSGGTQDQFLIALRLAFAQSILDSRTADDKYMLLMDECISSSDDARKQGIFEVLEAMKKTFSQIFVIAHEDISGFLDNYVMLTRDENDYTQIISRSW